MSIYIALLHVQGGRTAHKGGGWGIGSGEGPSISNAPRHTVKIFNHHAEQNIDVEVPEDRLVKHAAAFVWPLDCYSSHPACMPACLHSSTGMQACLV